MTAHALWSDLPGRVPGPYPSIDEQGHSNKTQMDSSSPRCGRQRDRGRTRERSCTEARITAELFQSIHLPRSCSQTTAAPRGENRVGECMGARKDQSADQATDRSTNKEDTPILVWASQSNYLNPDAAVHRTNRTWRLSRSHQPTRVGTV